MPETALIAAAVAAAALWLLWRAIRQVRALAQGRPPSCSATGCPHHGHCKQVPGSAKDGGPPCSG